MKVVRQRFRVSYTLAADAEVEVLETSNAGNYSHRFDRQ